MNTISIGGRSFWYALLAMSVSMMAIALFFQYYLDYAPCVLCVHIRVWVIAMGVVSLIALIIPKSVVRYTAFLITSGFLYLFGRDVFELWQIEAGHKMGSCSWSAGFPEFLPLNEWVPSLFEIGGICGESPEMLFGITMAETLMSVTGVLVAFFVITFIATLRHSMVQKNAK